MFIKKSSRIIISSNILKSIPKPLPQKFFAPAFKNLPIFLVQQKCFSSDIIEKSQIQLNKALDSEIKYENENYSQIEDILNYLNESGFTFNENEEGLKMNLKK